MPSVTRSQLMVYGALALAALAVGGRWLAAHGQGEARGGSGAAAHAAASGAPDGGDSGGVVVRAPSRAVVVHVAGAVHRPGVYALRQGDRVQDAVRRAGGASAHGDVDAINLAAPLQDGVQIVVPRRLPAAAGAVAAAPGAAAGPDGVVAPPVDLNTATAEELDTLDGVGPSTAAKILDYRRQHGGFRTVEDLGQVPGIGPKKLAALRDKVRT